MPQAQRVPCHDRCSKTSQKNIQRLWTVQRFQVRVGGSFWSSPEPHHPYNPSLSGSMPLEAQGGTKASRAVVGLQYLLGPVSENPPMQQSSLARSFKQRKGKITKKKNAPQMEAHFFMRTQDVQHSATYVCMHACMHGCMDAWMHGCMDAWMHGWMDAWMHGCMDVWMYGCIDVWMYGCMYVCMHACMYVCNAK